ncbi:phosphodiesterase [Pseudomonas protegens]|uniref:phosphodiesterase n=1 Tax=Pseudomonas protegens TaxID=380021 RepID=UPI002025735F|nr:phosphodiesterase [Pseudomonas protegens]MCL9657977.1 phosphodiesterase [Pseudomonas protegens]
MKIISHRGYWKTPAEKNTLLAFERSFDLGFGTETDVRDYNGKLVISHDIPDTDAITLQEFFQCLGGRRLPIALNIKSDGLRDLVLEEIQRSDIKDAFVFDMSVPDQKAYLLQDVIKVFTRMSEQELKPAFYEESQGIWLDAFSSQWFGPDEIASILGHQKEVCLVSPELHGRPALTLWSRIKDHKITRSDNLILCTDTPEAAAQYFKEALHD